MNANNSIEVDELNKPYIVWFEENWMHDDVLHKHQKDNWYMWKAGSSILPLKKGSIFCHRTMPSGYHLALFIRPIHIPKRSN